MFEVSLLGAVTREGKVPDLLYAVTSHRPKEKIYNIVQWSGAILGQSRAIFFSKILAVLTYFSAGKVQITYGGKDASNANNVNT